jgi:hypothetical protein
MFLRFVDFWETHKPELIDQEIHLFSDTLKVAGTTDLVCKIGNDLWIIDHKTSNHIQTTYELQAAVYAHCYEECYGIKPDKTGILWLKSSKRKCSKDKRVLGHRHDQTIMSFLLWRHGMKNWIQDEERKTSWMNDGNIGNHILQFSHIPPVICFALKWDPF